MKFEFSKIKSFQRFFLFSFSLCLLTANTFAQNNYDPYDNTSDERAGWMPIGLLEGYENTTPGDLIPKHSSYYGPDLNSVTIAPLSSIKTPEENRFHLPLTYRQAVDFLQSDTGSYKNAVGDEIGDMRASLLQNTTYPDWDNPEWARNHVLSVATALTKEKYSGCLLNTFYATENVKISNKTPCNNGTADTLSDGTTIYRGMDCSNFTTFVYNYALGYRFSSQTDKQAGGYYGSANNYFFPNQEPTNSALNTEKTAGKLVCADGQTSANGWCSSYFSSFDTNGIRRTSGWNDASADSLKAGDLLFFEWDASGNVDHAAIWTGKKTVNGKWMLIHSSTYNDPSRNKYYPNLAEYDTGSLNSIWAVRRVIEDGADKSTYTNFAWPNNNVSSARDNTSVDGQYLADVSGKQFYGTHQADRQQNNAAPSYAVATNILGTRVLAYEENNNIYLDVFNHDGSSNLSKFQVNLSGGTQKNPDVALDKDGNIAVVWEEDTDGNGYYQVVMSVLNENGNFATQHETVNVSGAGQQVKAKVAMMHFPSPNISKIAVTWQDDQESNGYYDIRARGYQLDNNQNVTENFADRLIPHTYNGDQLAPAIDMDKYGNFVIVWENDANLDGIYEIFVRGFWANGNARFPHQQVNTNANGQQRNPDVATSAYSSDRRYVVTWDDTSGSNGKQYIYAKGFLPGTDNGSYSGNVSTTFEDKIVAERISTTIQTNPSIGMDEMTAEFVIIWQENCSNCSTSGIEFMAKGFNQDGTDSIADFKVGPSQLLLRDAQGSEKTVNSVSVPKISLINFEDTMMLGYSYTTTDDPNAHFMNLDRYQLH